MDLISLRDHRAAFRPEFPICSPIGALTWDGVFVAFAFPPRSPPQPRSPKGLTRWGTDARLCPSFEEFKTEMYLFFYARLPRAQIYLIGTAPNRPGDPTSAHDPSPGFTSFSTIKPKTLRMGTVVCENGEFRADSRPDAHNCPRGRAARLYSREHAFPTVLPNPAQGVMPDAQRTGHTPGPRPMLSGYSLQDRARRRPSCKTELHS